MSHFTFLANGLKTKYKNPTTPHCAGGIRMNTWQRKPLLTDYAFDRTNQVVDHCDTDLDPTTAIDSAMD